MVYDDKQFKRNFNKLKGIHEMYILYFQENVIFEDLFT